ncbi:MAG: oligosaccharide flippase family protein, partial [Planctomycetaceae bacterium]|nr:oligosaccharide flippase family protein [Planctomycetaceae bacterium]
MLRRFLRSETLVSDAVQSLVIRVTGIGLMFVMTTMTARLLGPDDFGIFSAALSLAALLATLAPLGSDRIAVRHLSLQDEPAGRGYETALTHHCAVAIGALIVPVCLILGLWGGLVRIPVHWQTTILLGLITFVPITLAYLRQWIAVPLSGSRRAMAPEQMVLPGIFIAAVLVLHQLQVPLTGTLVTVLYAI